MDIAGDLHKIHDSMVPNTRTCIESVEVRVSDSINNTTTLPSSSTSTLGNVICPECLGRLSCPHSDFVREGSLLFGL